MSTRSQANPVTQGHNLRVQLLGPPEICWESGESIELPRKVRALFIYLATRRGTTVPRQTLLGLFWGDRSEEQARASLRQALSILRGALSDDADAVLASTAETVTIFSDGVTTDLDLLDAIDESGDADVAAKLVERDGFEFLEGLSLNEGPFEDWLAIEREKVRIRVRDALKAAARRSAREPKSNQAMRALAAVLRIDPSDEEAHRSLMRLYIAQGRPDAALQQFERCRANLKAHLNVTPAPETVALCREARSARVRGDGHQEQWAAAQPYLLVCAGTAGFRPSLEGLILAHGGRVIGNDTDTLLADFPDCQEALRAALDIRQRLREIAGDDHISQSFALGALNRGEPAAQHRPQDLVRLQNLVAAVPAGELHVSEGFFLAVRRNSPCFFEEVRSENADSGQATFRAGRPMHRQPYLAVYENSAPRQEKRPCSLAVAPIKHLGPDDGSQDYLAEGLTEDLILELSRTHRIQVSSRTTLFAIKSHDAVEIGRELGVGYVLGGSLRTVGRNIRLNLSLAETGAGNVVWSERFVADFENIFEVLDEIVAKVVARIAGKIEQSEIEAARVKRPENMTAYEYYLRGIWHHRLGGVTSEHSRKAVYWLSKAIKADPNFYRPRAMLCCAWSDLPEYDEERADRSVTRAYEADPADPEANRIMAWVKFTMGEYEVGIRLAERSVELAPHDAYLLGRCAVMHIFYGDAETGLERLRRAEELDPFVPVYIVEERLTAYYALGDYERVIAEARQLHHQTRRSRYYTAASLVALGRTDAALDVVQSLRRDDPDLSLEYVRGQELFRDKDLLRTLFDRLSTAGVPGDATVE